MNKALLAAAGGLLVMGPLVMASEASAQVTSVTSGQTVTTILPFSSTHAVANSATQLSTTQNGGGPGYQDYQVSTAITPSDIIFGDSAITLGTLSSITTSTDVNITFTNQGSAPVVPTLQSQITPGGFGLYVGDPNSNPTFQHGVIGNAYMTPETGPNPNCGCNPVTTIAGFASGPGNYPAPGYQNDIAGASFSFQILSNGKTVEDISGALAISFNPANPSVPIITVNLSPQAVAALPSFRLLTSPSDPSALGYQWDTSNLTVALGGLLAPGASDTVSYDTTVSVYSFAGVDTVFQDGRGHYFTYPQLLAYSGFGDPIGKGGGGTPPVVRFPGDVAKAGSPDSGPIQDVYFPRFQLGLPTFDPLTGELSLPLSDQLLPSLPLSYTETVVPEPETWALMLAGLGGVALAVRRRARPRTGPRTGRRLA
jgi:hypothetical protein